MICLHCQKYTINCIDNQFFLILELNYHNNIAVSVSYKCVNIVCIFTLEYHDV